TCADPFHMVAGIRSLACVRLIVGPSESGQRYSFAQVFRHSSMQDRNGGPLRCAVRRFAGTDKAIVITTYASYATISRDLPKSLARVAEKPEVARETEYYLSK